jgi:hypothetical protein
VRICSGSDSWGIVFSLSTKWVLEKSSNRLVSTIETKDLLLLTVNEGRGNGHFYDPSVRRIIPGERDL